MSHSAKVTIGEKKGQTTVLVCGECNRSTAHEILLYSDSEDATPDREYMWSNHYQIVQCKGCLTISFCQLSSNSEDSDPEDPSIAVVTKTVYPSRVIGRTPLGDLHHLSFELSKVYEETRVALIQNLAVLAGIGIRAIVEAVCNDKHSTGRDLYQKINALSIAKLITKADAEILQDLRFMGNQAAHEVKAHKQEELSLAFDVVEHLLRTVYILPEQTKRLPKQNRSRK